MNVRIAAAVLGFFVCHQAVAADDYVKYYHGDVFYTSTEASKPAPPCTGLALKKEVLPSKSQVIETATMQWSGKLQDLQTVVSVKGSTGSVNAYNGTIVGTGILQGLPWNWNYFEMKFVVVPTGQTVKDINIISDKKLTAWKETRDADGKLEQLWQSDLDEISADEFQSIYARMHSLNDAAEDCAKRYAELHKM